MGLQEMRTLPHALKPLNMVLAIVLVFFVFLGPFQVFFGWLPILLGLLQMLFFIAIFVIFAFNIPIFQTAPNWPLIEICYSIVLAFVNLVNFIVLCSEFRDFKFWILPAIACAMGLIISNAFNAWWVYRWENMGGSTNNQATAQPSSVNPAP